MIPNRFGYDSGICIFFGYWVLIGYVRVRVSFGLSWKISVGSGLVYVISGSDINRVYIEPDSDRVQFGLSRFGLAILQVLYFSDRI